MEDLTALNLEMGPRLRGDCEAAELFIREIQFVGAPGALHASSEKEEPTLACPGSSIEVLSLSLRDAFGFGVLVGCQGMKGLLGVI